MKFTRSLFVGVGVALILVGGTTFALISPRVAGSSSHQMQIVFPSGDGLVSGSDVLEAGTKIGYISDIQPTRSNSAFVTIQISDNHWPLHQGVTADIRPKSLLGEKYVDVHDGAQNHSAYDASAVLDLHASQSAVPVELDQFINSLDPATRTAIRVLLDDLGAGISGQGNNLNTAIATGKANLEHLATFGTTLNNRDPDLDKILVGLDGVLGKITTNDQLTQMSQLITNGQHVLNDIEAVQGPFSRQFNDASVALGELNTAFGNAVPSLRSTIDIAPTLISNLQTESTILAGLACDPSGCLTGTQNLSPHGECSSASRADQPITSVTGFPQCSPIWMLVAGLLGGPTVTGGAVEKTAAGQQYPTFRVCILGYPPQNDRKNNPCDNINGSQGPGSSLLSPGLMRRDGAMLAAFLGT